MSSFQFKISGGCENSCSYQGLTLLRSGGASPCCISPSGSKLSAPAVATNESFRGPLGYLSQVASLVPLGPLWLITGRE